jgi:hypothetical protein
VEEWNVGILGSFLRRLNKGNQGRKKHYHPDLSTHRRNITMSMATGKTMTHGFTLNIYDQ